MPELHLLDFESCLFKQPKPNVQSEDTANVMAGSCCERTVVRIRQVQAKSPYNRRASLPARRLSGAIDFYPFPAVTGRNCLSYDRLRASRVRERLYVSTIRMSSEEHDSQGSCMSSNASGGKEDLEFCHRAGLRSTTALLWSRGGGF